jgi:hypothetical protein
VLREVEDGLSGRGSMLSLVGLAGTGKTAIALELAHRAVERRAYAGGVWWLAAEGPPSEALARLLPALRAAAPAVSAPTCPDARQDRRAPGPLRGLRS